MDTNFTKAERALQVAEDAQYRAKAGESAYTANGNHANQQHTGTAVTTIAAVVSATVTPKVSGVFSIAGYTYGAPTAGTPTAVIGQLSDGTNLDLDGTPAPFAGVLTGGTATTIKIGTSLNTIHGGYAIGTPVTFSLLVTSTGGTYTDAISSLSVVELAA